MKRIIEFIIAIALAVLLFLPCRNFAVKERGNEAIGGEALVPVMVLIGYIWYADYKKEKEEGEILRSAQNDITGVRR